MFRVEPECWQIVSFSFYPQIAVSIVSCVLLHRRRTELCKEANKSTNEFNSHFIATKLIKNKNSFVISVLKITCQYNLIFIIQNKKISHLLTYQFSGNIFSIGLYRLPG